MAKRQWDWYTTPRECRDALNRLEAIAGKKLNLPLETYALWLEGYNTRAEGKSVRAFERELKRVMPKGLYEQAEQLARCDGVVDAFLRGKTRVKLGGLKFDWGETGIDKVLRDAELKLRTVRPCDVGLVKNLWNKWFFPEERDLHVPKQITTPRKLARWVMTKSDPIAAEGGLLDFVAKVERKGLFN